MKRLRWVGCVGAVEKEAAHDGIHRVPDSYGLVASWRWHWPLGWSSTTVGRAVFLVLWRWQLGLFLVWRLSIISVFPSQPAVSCLVLDIQVAIFDDNQVHILEYADSHEYKAVAHQLANYAILPCRVSESYEDRVSVHHGKEGIGSVAKVTEELPIIPKDGNRKQAVSNENGHYSSHDLDIQRYGNLKRSRDNAILGTPHKIPRDCDPIDGTAEANKQFDLDEVEIGGQDVKERSKDGE